MNFKDSNFISYIKTFTFYKRFLISFFILANIILWLQNYSFFFQLIKIGGSFFDALLSVYDIASTYTTVNFILIATSLILSSFNISLLLHYTDLLKKISTKTSTKKHNALVSSGIFLATLASHCASCGAALFGSFISLAFLSYLPFGGLEIGVLSILVLLYSNYSLIKKINNPYIC